MPVPSEVLRRRVLELRNHRHWTQDEFAARMTEYGMPWWRATVAKIETGTRQVTVDELVCMALVLGVSPIALLIPEQPIEQMRLAPNTVTASAHAWNWMAGDQPMGGTHPGDVLTTVDDHEAQLRFYEEACPTTITSAERRLPGLRNLRRTLAHIQNAVWGRSDVTDDAIDDIVAQLLGEVVADAKHLHSVATRKARRNQR